MIRWQDNAATRGPNTGRDVDCGAAWALTSARLRGRIGRAAVFATDAMQGAAALRTAGLDAVAFGADAAGAATDASLGAFDAVVLIDVLGVCVDDDAVVRSLARRTVAGTRLVGAVVRAEVGQSLAAPRRHGFSVESLDALLVRSGWSAPVLVGRTAKLLVFESVRAECVEPALAIAAASRAVDAPTDAVSTLERVTREAEAASEPADVRELMLALGGLRLALGEDDAAERAFTAANAIAPTCARPVVALASLALRRAERDDAEALFDHALAADATNVDAWRGLATVFEARGEIGRAIESLECAASLAPSDAGVAIALSKLLAAEGNASAAAAALEHVLPYGDASDAIRNAYSWLVASSRRVATGPRTGSDAVTPVVGTNWKSSATTLAS